MCCGTQKVYLIKKAYLNKLQGKNKELSAQRMEICNACELLIMGICQACFCPMAIKSTLKEVECEHPDGPKWLKAV